MDPNMAEAPSGGGIGGIIALLILVVILVFYIITCWKVYSKAGKPGWAAIIPIYNMIVFLQICGKPLWWLILWFIPIVNIIIFILLSVALAQVFGKGTGFGIGLVLLGFIFYPILAFGSAKYVGPGGQSGEASPA